MIDLESFNEYISIIEEAGFNPYPDYSGRGMYGDRCLGMVISDSQFTVCAEMVRIALKRGWNIYDFQDIFGQGTRQDSMGLDTIVYWPYIRTPEDYSRNIEEEYEDED